MSQTPKIRRFRWNNLNEWTDLFNEVCEFTGTASAFDLELSKQFLSQPVYGPEEDCFLAELDGSIVGFVLIAPELQIGRSVLMGGVLKAYRNRGIGRMLLAEAMRRVDELGTPVIHVQVPSDSKVCIHLLESIGFSAVRTYSLMKWKGDSVPSGSIPPGFQVRAFRTNKDEKHLTKLQNDVFGTSWGFCPNTVDDIKSKLRLKTCDPNGVIIATYNGGMAGYNWTFSAVGTSDSIGWIGMTGVHPDYRGHGLGKAVALAGMKFLTKKGINLIELEVDDQNIKAKSIYCSIGFSTTQRRLWYELIS